MSSIEGNSVIINMHKTGYRVTIPLTQKARELLPAKTSLHLQPVFRVYCNKVTNRILKQIGQRCSFQKKETSGRQGTRQHSHWIMRFQSTAGMSIQIHHRLVNSIAI